MTRYTNALSPAEEAQFREDVHAVLEEVEGGLTMDEVLERVRHREIKRVVDGLVEEGLLEEVEQGSYFPTQKGLQWIARGS